MSQREIFKPFSVIVSGIAVGAASEITLYGTGGVAFNCNYITAQIINTLVAGAGNGAANPTTFTLAPSALAAGIDVQQFPHGYDNAGGTGGNFDASAIGTPGAASIGGVVVGTTAIATLSLPDGQACTSVALRNDTGDDDATWAVTYGVVKFSNPLRDGSMNPGM